MRTAVSLVDFGSTFTKLRAVAPGGELLAAVQHRTTVDTDVFDGLRAATDELAQRHPDVDAQRILACSSAGGGLRMAVVGLVEDLTAEAARQAALSAGARVARVVSGGLPDPAAARALLAEEPDIVLLVGGTDGGDRAVLCESARALAEVACDVPIVLAGNAEAQPEAASILRAAGHHVTCAPNVMPEINTLAPGGVRDVVRELFISHVIGGKLASAGGDLEELVRMATPDAVLTGVELLAHVLADRGHAGGELVVDVGGATTDVHSALPHDPSEPRGYKRNLLPQAASARTVEADLGMRWNAPGIVDAALGEGLIGEGDALTLEPAARRRAANPGFLPEDEFEQAIDCRLAQLAIAVALRRHAGRRRLTLTPDGAVLQRDGRDLTHVPLVLGTGGVFRALSPSDLAASIALARAGREQRLLPQGPSAGIDTGYVLAAAGILATEDSAAARQLLDVELAALVPARAAAPDTVSPTPVSARPSDRPSIAAGRRSEEP
jgi:uncharacterized protein (TIGR01319 family)